MKKNNLSSLSDTAEIKTIISGKISTAPSEVINGTLSEIKIKNIVDRLKDFSDSNSLIGDFLIEIDIRKDSSLLDIVNNVRVSGLNFLHILYLFSENDVRDFMAIEGLKLSREDIFLGELLSGITHEGDKEINTLLKLEDFIEQIYKNGESNFDIISKMTNKTFVEFLLSTYSYYLQFSDSIKGGNLVHHIIYDFLGHLINNNKIHFDKNTILKYIDELSKGLPSVSFYKGMYMIKRLFEDYQSENKNDKIEEKTLDKKVEYALSKYGEQLRMAISK